MALGTIVSPFQGLLTPKPTQEAQEARNASQALPRTKSTRYSRQGATSRLSF